MIRYKLNIELAKRNMKKTDLIPVISSPTVAKLSKHEGVSFETIDKICELLQCQPGDILEWIPSPKNEDKKQNGKD